MIGNLTNAVRTRPIIVKKSSVPSWRGESEKPPKTMSFFSHQGSSVHQVSSVDIE